MNVDCDYCKKPAELVSGEVIYPHRKDLSQKMFWFCRPCEASVGTHRDCVDNSPLGRLANGELRKWKIRAHEAFDPTWIKGSLSRKQAYLKLANSLGISRSKCHIGMFDVDTCKRVVEICIGGQ